MYKHNARQISLVDEKPEMFGNLPLNPENRWVKLARLIPWSRVEEEYQKNFKSTRGQDPLPSRLALGILIVKEKLSLSDRDTVEVLKENPYIQYFVGYSEYKYDVHLDPLVIPSQKEHCSELRSQAFRELRANHSEDREPSIPTSGSQGFRAKGACKGLQN